MAALYLIRHGQAAFNSDDYDQLTPLGLRQSEILGQALQRRGVEFDAVFMGAMKRHAQTAEGCLRAMNCRLSPQILVGFNEYDHEEVLARHRPEFGDKLQLAEYLAQHPHPRRAFQAEFELALHRWRGGDHDHDYNETWPHFKQRCIRALNQVRQQRDEARSLAVFSSGGPIAVCVGHCLGLSDAHIAELSWSIMNGSVTCLLFTEDKISLRYFNDFSAFDHSEQKTLLTHR
ncbi:MAG: histidine phosphatase family protein [Pseudomonadota bacterium]|nr:histidine phosphatase family protein [Pseudomonadota bacterium]